MQVALFWGDALRNGGPVRVQSTSGLPCVFCRKACTWGEEGGSSSSFLPIQQLGHRRTVVPREEEGKLPTGAGRGWEMDAGKLSWKRYITVPGTRKLILLEYLARGGAI